MSLVLRKGITSKVGKIHHEWYVVLDKIIAVEVLV
jgi:hypothetical protein